MTAFLSAWSNGSLIRISKSDDANVFWMGTINSTSENLLDFTIGVTTVITNGTFTDGDKFVISYSQKGDTGSGGVTIDPYEDVGNVNSITWDVSGTSTNYEATLTGNTTLDLTNVRNGDYGSIIVNQDGVGSHTLSFGTVNGVGGTHRVVNGGAGAPTLTSNPNAIDILSFTYNGSVMYWTVGNDYT